MARVGKCAGLQWNRGGLRGLRIYPRAGDPTTVPVESADPWDPEIDYFVECVEQVRAPERAPGEQARLALAVSLATARSLESGRPKGIGA